MKYLKVFETEALQNEFREGDNYTQPHVSCLTSGDKVKYNQYSKEYYKMLNTPLTFEATHDGTTIYFRQSSYAVDEGLDPLKVEVSTDNGETWTEVIASPAENDVPGAILAELDNGEKILIRGRNDAYGWQYSGDDFYEIADNCNFWADSSCYVYGNIMSLIGGDDFARLRSVEDYAFSYFFSGYDTELDWSWVLSKEGEELLLPATILSDYCYESMFRYCANLTKAPELPATTLAQGCYIDMFNNCRSLITAPALPATTLAKYCYNSMFYNCTNLTTAPELSATTLESYCYASMFRYCISLTMAPELPATTLATSCYDHMFSNCTSLTTVPELPATTLENYCYSCMFHGCTNLTTVTDLPATTLANGCYDHMFQGCTSLTIAQSILPAQTLKSYCYAYMFYGCDKLIKAPVLPALTLVSNCYKQMFKGCSSLNYIKALFTTTPSAAYTDTWVQQVSGSGTFVKNVNASWTVVNNYGVPIGWTIETASS